VQGLWNAAQTKCRGLLRVLLLWLCQMPTHSTAETLLRRKLILHIS
jgi:hypothetical protein